jgi:hypothetical protein
MKLSTIIVSTVVIGVASVLASTYLVPSKGERNRRKLIRKGREYKDKLFENFHEIADSVTHSFESAEDEAIRLGKVASANAKKLAAEVNGK